MFSCFNNLTILPLLDFFVEVRFLLGFSALLLFWVEGEEEGPCSAKEARRATLVGEIVVAVVRVGDNDNDDACWTEWRFLAEETFPCDDAAGEERVRAAIGSSERDGDPAVRAAAAATAARLAILAFAITAWRTATFLGEWSFLSLPAAAASIFACFVRRLSPPRLRSRFRTGRFSANFAMAVWCWLAKPAGWGICCCC